MPQAQGTGPTVNGQQAGYIHFSSPEPDIERATIAQWNGETGMVTIWYSPNGVSETGEWFSRVRVEQRVFDNLWRAKRQWRKRFK